METYPINKGIGRSVEFQGLKSQYLFIFAGGLLALFVLFVILYMAGYIKYLFSQYLKASFQHSFVTENYDI